ncbi:MAG TPA: proton-conducting transporter membrane subunit [Candidatus Eisenbacteria bacterium]
MTLYGPLALRLDPVAVVFLAPIALIGALALIYAPAYSRLGRGAPFERGRAATLGHLATLTLLLASMALVVVAANTVLLLVAWEIMTIASWALLTEEHHAREVRVAGLGYLVAGHVSGAALAVLFVLLATAGGGWQVPVAPVDAARFGVSPVLLFALALVGFGTKAAVAPLHVWLPDAHASAPSHVSALLSGVLVTLGIYGLVRFVPFLGSDPGDWGMALMALGAAGACGGIVMALGQRDVKRALAYSTIENVGLIALAIGAALVAGSAGQPLVAALAMSAALLHVWNHAIAKGLLFFSAGAIARLVGSRDLERWGGLLARLPLLGTGLLAGAAALVGLPGTHGFASEWLLFMALFRGSQTLVGPARFVMLLAVVATAFTTGAALAGFVRILGIGLLGHPRGPEAAAARPPRDAALALPVLVLAVSCVGLVPFLGPMLAVIGRAVAALTPGAPIDRVARLASPLPWLAAIPALAAVAFLLYRTWLERGRTIRRAVTWDCAYARPEATMQYTATSLAQPVTRLLHPALRTNVDWRPPQGLWPDAMTWVSRTPERALAEVYRPAFRRVAALLGFFRRIQEGRVMVYLRYVGVALLILLVWFFWPAGTPR